MSPWILVPACFATGYAIALIIGPTNHSGTVEARQLRLMAGLLNRMTAVVVLLATILHVFIAWSVRHP